MSTTTRPPWQAQALIDTPLGPMRLAATADGLGGAWFEGQRHHPGPLDAPLAPTHPVLRQAIQQLADYWQAPVRARFNLPLAPVGTAFQQAVWTQLQHLPAGSTTTYGALARELGRPQAVRAVGAAVGRNPLSLFIPCHRVLGTGGQLTGYAGGLDRKTALLRQEGAWPR
ncbi:methylated-DNA--[protein]-cysteine S-methyltransferase [Ideonella sp. B7]|uniref:methylated-DNA--[protein]-cysteine S-methyltransferase n=1 Tax=Ideonella benzenivorans TaxID=2831643 RepID=UPI001CEDF9BA|nr:methylated-DNA--[protein]-cysteine S-methyltransferase [Ideonella benzenivorans]MCA6216151.1 methylated-DNA--[protein]-cysteine S-methyltransferase [Ideonella benzenivorans]